jgi:hypothetical protein
MNIDLHIADYRIRMTETLDYPCLSWPLYPFGSFLDHSDGYPDFDGHPDMEIAVTVVDKLPDLPHGPPHFDACHGLWRLYEAPSGWLLESLDTRTHRPCSLGLIDETYSRISVWTCLDRMNSIRGWVPMKIINPIAEVCFLTILARQGGILLHSAGVSVPTGSYLFTGASGAGKSTLSGFFDAGGASVLSDERMVIRKHGKEFMIHGTPWIGNGAYAKNESGLLTELFCIRHGAAHRTEPMSPRAALAWLLPQCFLPHWDRTAMESTLTFLDDVIRHVSCTQLTFAKHPDVVEFLAQQVTKPALVLS